MVLAPAGGRHRTLHSDSTATCRRSAIEVDDGRKPEREGVRPRRGAARGGGVVGLNRVGRSQPRERRCLPPQTTASLARASPTQTMATKTMLGRLVRPVVLTKRLASPAQRVPSPRPLHSSPRQQSPHTAQYLSTTCPSCGASLPVTVAPVCAACSALLPPPPPSTSSFALFGLEPAFDLDQKTLKQAFLRYQQKVHPDLFSGQGEREAWAKGWSGRVNDAFRVLEGELSRGEYLVSALVSSLVSTELILHLCSSRSRTWSSARATRSATPSYSWPSWILERSSTTQRPRIRCLRSARQIRVPFPPRMAAAAFRALTRLTNRQHRSCAPTACRRVQGEPTRHGHSEKPGHPPALPRERRERLPRVGARQAHRDPALGEPQTEPLIQSRL